MRLNKILHPEMILNKRGPEHVRNFFYNTVRKIEFPKEGGGAIVPESVGRLNQSEHRSLTLMRRWQIDNGKVYHVSKDFLLALSGIERGVCLDYLPERFVAYISFADEAIYDDADEVVGAYVYVGPAKYTSLRDDYVDKKALWIAYICKNLAVGTTCVELKQGEMLEDALKSFEEDGGHGIVATKDARKRVMVHNTILNVVMYIHSQEPKVQRIPASQEISHRKASELANQTGLRNECTLPVTFVNWNYAKQRVYTTEKTWVESFPRWQRCGPGLSQIRLIWVAEHERHYKQEKA